jgi:tetratricopeptide (TPR) repeat protein
LADDAAAPLRYGSWFREIVSMLNPGEEAELRRRAKEALDAFGPSAATLEYLRLLVQIDAHNSIGWFNYGDSLRSVGRLIDAERALLTARELAPEKRRFTVDSRLAMVASQRGAPQDAEHWFQLATADVECEGWVWVLRAINLINMEAMPLAKQCLKTARERGNVDLDEILLNEALIERHAGNYELAATEARKALDLDPNYHPALQLLESICGAIEARVFASSLAEKNAG